MIGDKERMTSIIGKREGGMERNSPFSKGTKKTKRGMTALLSTAVAIDYANISKETAEISAESHTI